MCSRNRKKVETSAVHRATLLIPIALAAVHNIILYVYNISIKSTKKKKMYSPVFPIYYGFFLFRQ